MKAKITFFSIALLVAFLLLGCSNDENVSSSSSQVPQAPIGAKTQYLAQGSTVSQIKVQGTDIRWYVNLNDSNTNPVPDDLVEVNNISPMVLLSPDVQIRNNTKYYATQTVLNIQSREFLTVRVYCLAR